MAFLSPTLRFVREKRHEINMNDFINELLVYFEERWKDFPINIKLSTDDMPFFVRINKGKLIQIIDNLILNSEYWLKEDIKQGKIKKGVVTVNMLFPYVQVYDNGRGIDPTVEEILFEPFISTKIDGRGLGLFIVKQLLNSEGCDIVLLLDRNKKRRLFKFQIDLGCIIHE
jgi:signal transduction histidine kinase